MARLGSFGFVRPRCATTLAASEGREEKALALLLRDALERLDGAAFRAVTAEPGPEEAAELAELAEEEVSRHARVAAMPASPPCPSRRHPQVAAACGCHGKGKVVAMHVESPPCMCGSRCLQCR